MTVKKTDLMKLIKEKCLNCCCWESAEVKRCEIVHCPLHAVRLGLKGVVLPEFPPQHPCKPKELHPKPKRVRGPMTEEHKAALKAGRDATKK